MPQPTCFAIANQKGGVAKTTTTISLGVALHDLGYRVLMVDLDPQACMTFSLGIDPDALEQSVHDVLTAGEAADNIVVQTDDGPDLLPATIDLASAEAMLLTRTGREYALRNALDDLHEKRVEDGEPYDFILLDCPPSLGVLTINGLTAAEEVIIPLQCETLSHRGVGQLLDTIADNMARQSALTAGDLQVVLVLHGLEVSASAVEARFRDQGLDQLVVVAEDGDPEEGAGRVVRCHGVPVALPRRP